MDKNDFFELEGAIRKLMKKLPHAWKTHMKLGFSRTEALVLYKLHVQGRQRASRLAHSLSITTGGLTGVTDKLVSEGYIQRKRDNKDRRVVYLTISGKGNEALEALYASRRAFIDMLLDGIPAEELEQFHSVINKVLANLEPDAGQGETVFQQGDDEQ